jgi:hypothetical protein
LEKGKLKGMFVSGNMPTGSEYKDALQDVLQAFPYFQLAQVLFAKQMYDTNEPESSSRIKLASVYAPDRKAMYLLLKANSPVRTVSNFPPPAADVKPQDKGDVKYNFVYSSTTAGNIEVPNKDLPLPETFIRKESEMKLPLQASKVEEKKPEPISTSVKKPYTPPTIEKKRSMYQNKPEEKKPEKPKEIIPVIEKKIPIIEEEKLKAEPIPVTPPVIKAEKYMVNEPIGENSLQYSFSSWLKVLPEISVGKKEETKPLSTNDTSSIIDSFLKKAPGISRPKAEFFSPSKVAKKSITEDDTIVSETLAKIFVAQGNLSKALKAYQTLLLQFPEKKNIFAPRIEEIKALMRENSKSRS